MKKIYKLMLVAIMLATVRIGYSQNIGNNTLVAEKTDKSFVDNKCELQFEVVAEQAGNYHVCFWVYPLQYNPNTFASYQVCINDVSMGEIKPSVSGWQAIGLSDNSVVALVEGKNVITIKGDASASPMVERVQFAQDYASAQISNNLETETMSINETIGTYAMVQRINIRYTHNQQFFLSAGDRIRIESIDGLSHALDFRYIYTPGEDAPQMALQHLNWYNASEAYSTQNTKHKSYIDVKIPLTGYYQFKTRGGVNMQSQLIDEVRISIANAEGNVINSYLLNDCAAFYARLDGVIPSDSTTYTSRVTYNASGGTLSPVLCIEGGASEPGRVINQGGTASLSASYFDLNTTPIIKTTGYHLYNANSLGSGACQVELLYSSAGNVIPAMQMAKNNNTLGVSESSLGALRINQTSADVMIYGAVDAAIYTFDGVKVAEASGSESVSLSTAELPIGVYVVKATDSTGNSLIQKIVVK